MAATRLPEQKVILCGEYGSGKSSIFRRYANNTFVTSSDRSSTLGLDHYSKSFTANDREVKVNGDDSMLHTQFGVAFGHGDNITILFSFVFLIFYVRNRLDVCLGHWRHGTGRIGHVKLL